MSYTAITTLEAAYQAKGLTRETTMPDMSCLPEHLREAAASVIDWMIIAEALNGDWVADYNNRNQVKWEIIWDMSGSAPSLSVVDFDCRTSSVGSRLVFASREIAGHFAEYFLPAVTPFLIQK